MQWSESHFLFVMISCWSIRSVFWLAGWGLSELLRRVREIATALVTRPGRVKLTPTNIKRIFQVVDTRGIPINPGIKFQFTPQRLKSKKGAEWLPLLRRGGSVGWSPTKKVGVGNMVHHRSNHQWALMRRLLVLRKHRRKMMMVSDLQRTLSTTILPSGAKRPNELTGCSPSFSPWGWCWLSVSSSWADILVLIRSRSSSLNYSEVSCGLVGLPEPRHRCWRCIFRSTVLILKCLSECVSGNIDAVICITFRFRYDQEHCTHSNFRSQFVALL